MQKAKKSLQQLCYFSPSNSHLPPSTIAWTPLLGTGRASFFTFNALFSDFFARHCASNIYRKCNLFVDTKCSLITLFYKALFSDFYCKTLSELWMKSNCLAMLLFLINVLRKVALCVISGNFFKRGCFFLQKLIQVFLILCF